MMMWGCCSGLFWIQCRTDRLHQWKVKTNSKCQNVGWFHESLKKILTLRFGKDRGLGYNIEKVQGDLWCFFFFYSSFFLSFRFLYMFLCMWKTLNVKKVKLNRRSSFPQKTLLLKRLLSCPAFYFCAYVTSHCVTESHVCIVYASQLLWQVRIDSWSFVLVVVVVVVSGAELSRACVS